jgi:hypothetical protein
MNLLPNFENAFIPIEKLTEYSLNEFHPIGGDKALVFKEVLNIHYYDAEKLISLIHEGLKKNECNLGNKDNYGQRYSVKMEIWNSEKNAIVTTAWIILSDENFPRLTSCYIKNK